MSEVEVPEGGDLVSTGAWKFETRAELVGSLVKPTDKDTKANDNVELALAA